MLDPCGRVRLAAAALAAACALSPTAAFAGPPFQTDDPDPTAYRNYEIYLNVQQQQTTGGTTGTYPALEINYGLMPNVQFSVTMQRSGARLPNGSGGFGFGDAEIALKVRFIQETRTLPQVAFYPSVTVPSGDGARGLGEGGTTVFLPVWAQKDLGVWTTFGGGGVDHRSTPGSKNSSFTGIAAQRDISERDAYGFELYHTTSDHPGGSDTTSAGIGFIHRVGALHAVLVSVGRAIRGDNGFTGYAAYEFNLGPKPRAGAAAEQP